MPDTTLSKLRNQLAEAIFDDRNRDEPPPPLACSEWVAMSALQKAIRRNQPEIGLRAAATLFREAPERVWRRIAIAAFEDIGVADFETVSLTIAGLAGKRWREEVGGEWRVASFLIRRLAAASKCRAIDDAYMIAEKHPRFAKLRLDMAAGAIGDSLSLLHKAKAVEEQSVAVWSVNAFLREGRGKRTHRDPFLLLEAFAAMGVPAYVLDICEEGYKKTRETLPLLFPLIYLAKPACGDVVDDVLPEETFVNGVPSWAVDYFCREGREAFRRFLLTDCKTAVWIRARIPRSGQIELMGLLTFALEGGQMRKRLRWELADRLRATWQRECLSRHCPDATEVLALMADDLHILNDVRASCL
jgi:hypothetical protein